MKKDNFSHRQILWGPPRSPDLSFYHDHAYPVYLDQNHSYKPGFFQELRNNEFHNASVKQAFNRSQSYALQLLLASLIHYLELSR